MSDSSRSFCVSRALRISRLNFVPAKYCSFPVGSRRVGGQSAGGTIRSVIEKSCCSTCGFTRESDHLCAPCADRDSRRATVPFRTANEYTERVLSRYCAMLETALRVHQRCQSLRTQSQVGETTAAAVESDHTASPLKRAATLQGISLASLGKTVPLEAQVSALTRHEETRRLEGIVLLDSPEARH